MKDYKRYLQLSCLILFLLVFPATVSAQTMDGTFNISSPTNQLSAGSDTTITLSVNSQEQINAVQATMIFPPTLTFEKIDATGSPFGIDLKSGEEAGEIKIARGTTNPISGNNLVVKVLFHVDQATDPKDLILTNPTLIASAATNKNIFSGTTYHSVSGTNNQSVTQVSVPQRYLPSSSHTASTISQKSFLERFFDYILSVLHLK